MNLLDHKIYNIVCNYDSKCFDADDIKREVINNYYFIEYSRMDSETRINYMKDLLEKLFESGLLRVSNVGNNFDSLISYRLSTPEEIVKMKREKDS